MSFQEAGKQNRNDGPLNIKWKKLHDYMCPMCECEDQLTYFEHLLLWKCGCGFKISKERFQCVSSQLDENSFNSGFRYGNYQDEPPF